MRPLESFLATLHDHRGPLCTQRLDALRDALGRLARCGSELERAVDLQTPDAVLFQDGEHGPRLLAHLATQGTYLPPHDHGEAWVLYAVISGAMAIGTWGHVPQGDGRVRLVRRSRSRVVAGDVHAFLPGDIHDTFVVTETVRMLRLTSCDVAAERAAGRMQVFENPDG